MKKLAVIAKTFTLLTSLIIALYSCIHEESIVYVITEGQLVGSWSFEKFEYNYVEYQSTNENVCNMIQENLGEICFINTGFNCEWGKSSIFGWDIVRWQFTDNCNQRSNWPARVMVHEGDILEMACYEFKALSFNSGKLVLKIISSNNSNTYPDYPQLPIGGIYTFKKNY